MPGTYIIYYGLKDTVNNFEPFSRYDTITVTGATITITKPKAPYKFTFTDADTGKLEIDAEATTQPASLQNLVHWSITPIVGSSLIITPDSIHHKAVTFKFANLPDSNNQFGIKKIKATIPEYNIADSIFIYCFYWKNGNVVPNFLNDIEYGFLPSSPGAYGYTRLSNVYLTSKADSIIFPDTGIAVGNYRFYKQSGIDCTAFTVGHERFHEWIYDQWSSGNWGTWKDSTDWDQDYLPNWFERDSSGTDSLISDTFGIQQIFGWTTTIGDCEYWACVKGIQNHKGDSLKDWSHGKFSKQWPVP
jgi:hypothetical protein